MNDQQRICRPRSGRPLTRMPLNTTSFRLAIGILILMTGPLVAVARAQDRPAPAAQIAIGWVGFADDGIVSEILFGGEARWYLGRRIAIGPEVAYIGGENHSHFVLTGNLTFDLRAPIDGRPRPITPFIVVGGGLFQTHESFPTGGSFTSSEGAFTVGGGVRAQLGETMTAGVDVRMGWEPHIRVNGFIGFRLGR